MNGFRLLKALGIAIAAVCCVVAGTSCDKDPLSPPRPRVLVRTTLQLSASLPEGAGDLLDVAEARVTLEDRIYESTKLDTIVEVSLGRGLASCSVFVQVSPYGGAFDLSYALLDGSGAPLFESEEDDVSVEAGTRVALEPEVQYVGPGAAAAAVNIQRTEHAVFGGDTVSLSASVLDTAGVAVVGAPVLWRSLDTATVSVLRPDTGAIIADSTRKTVQVTATLLTGEADTASIRVQPPPDQLMLVEGAGQAASVGAALPEPLVLELTGTDGSGLSDVPVAFFTDSGMGILSSDTAFTDEDGRAEVSWVLGGAAGTQTGRAMVVGRGVELQLEAMAEPGPPADLQILSGENQGGQPGSSVAAPFRVRVRDEFGNPVDSAVVRWSVKSGGGSLSSDTTIADPEGIASNSYVRGLELGVDTIIAGIATGDSAAFLVFTIYGSPNALAFVGDPEDGSAGGPLGAAVLIYDDNGDVATDDSATTVNLALANGATLGGTITRTATGGVVLFDDLMVVAAGHHNLTATADGLSADTSAEFEISAAEPAALRFSTEPGSIAAGDTIAPALEVRVNDMYANQVLQDSITLVQLHAISDTGDTLAFFSGASSVVSLGGVATFPDISLEEIGTVRLIASADSLVPDTTAPFTVAPGHVFSLSLLTQPTDVRAGEPQPAPLEVRLLDAWGNVASGDTSTVTLSILEGTGNPNAPLRGETAVSPGAGKAAFSDIAIDSAAVEYRLLVSALGAVPDTSASFSVFPGEAARLVFDEQPSLTTQRVPFSPPIQLSVRDSIGNVATADTSREVTLAIVEGTGTPGALLSYSTSSTSAGLVVFDGLSIDTSGTDYQLSAVSGSFSALSDPFTILADTASLLEISVQPTSVNQHDSITPGVEVRALTAGGFIDPSYEDTVRVVLLESPTGDTLAGTKAVLAERGVATFDDLSIGTTSSGYRLLVTSGSLASDTSEFFDVAPENTSSIWTGTGSGSWSSVDSWAGGSLPSADDDIWIPARPDVQPILDTDVTIRNLTLEDGAVLQIGTYTLTVTGNLMAGNTIEGDSGETRLTGVGTTFSGTVSNLAVVGQAFLDGDATTTGYLNIEAQGSLGLTGFTLETLGDLSVVTGDSGTGLLLNNDEDELYVGGTARFSTAAQGTYGTEGNFTAGTMSFRGDLIQEAPAGDLGLVVAGSSVIFDGLERQTVTFATPGLAASRLTDVVCANVNGVEFSSDVFVHGELSVSAGAEVIQASPSSTYFSGPLPLVAGTYSVSDSRILGDVTVTEDLNLSGAGNNLHIEEGATFVLNGRAVDVGGDLTVVTAASGTGLVMTNPADYVQVGGDVTFTTASDGLADTEGNFSEGVLRVGGDFSQNQPGAGTRSFVATGTRVVLDGWDAQSIDLSTPGASDSRFDALEIANHAGGVTFASPIVADGMLVSPLAVTPTVSGNGRSLDVAGFDVDGLTLDNVALTSTEGFIRRFDDVTFQNYDPGATQLTVAHRGTAVSVFRRTSFLTTPGSGYYISAIDTHQDSDTLTINFSESIPEDGSSSTAVSGGAIVNWGVVPWSLIGSGGAFSCGVKLGGQAYCWGNNTSGERGDGTFAAANTPQEVTGNLNIRRFSVGADHSCSITVDAEAYCWGNNGSGRLGDGTTERSSVPVAVSGGNRFQQISAGYYSNCGIATDGLAYCWGRNSKGQVGDGTTEDRNVPVPVSGGMLFQAIATGGAHACGITYSGQAYCWGSNWGGQLGDGTTEDSSVPVLVAGGHRFTAVSAGDTHTCALSTDDTAYCWGSNAQGRLGDGTYTNRSIPMPVSGGHTFHSISAGGNHTCAITAAAVGYCWGDNGYGQIGDGTQTRRLEPVQFSADLRFQEIAAGKTPQTCAAAIDGSAYCWGWNFFGQLGDGTNDNSSSPVPVTEPW